MWRFTVYHHCHCNSFPGDLLWHVLKRGNISHRVLYNISGKTQCSAHMEMKAYINPFRPWVHVRIFGKHINKKVKTLGPEKQRLGEDFHASSSIWYGSAGETDVPLTWGETCILFRFHHAEKAAHEITVRLNSSNILQSCWGHESISQNMTAAQLSQTQLSCTTGLYHGSHRGNKKGR